MSLKSFLFSLSLIILLTSILIYWSIDMSYEEIEAKNNKAKCLDGSNYKFLFSKGKNDGENSFYIHFEMGGFCGDDNYSPNNNNAPLISCLERTKTSLGSNKFSFIYRYFNIYISRFLTSSKFFNPMFYNWNKVYIKYCDGSSHLGNVEQPIIYNNTKLYIRGEENVKFVFDYLLKNHNFKNAENVLTVGSSAGGIASVFYSKYIRNILNNKTNFKVISDSGYFLESNYSLSYRNINVFRDLLTKLKNSFHINNTKSMNLYGNELDFVNSCFPKNYMNSFKKDYDILFLTSSYDSWALKRILISTCFFKKNFIDDCMLIEKELFKRYSNDFIDEISKVIENDKEKKITAFVNNGFFHTYLTFSWSLNNKKYGIDGYSVQEFIKDWYYNLLPKNKKLYYDNKEVKKLADFYWCMHYYNLF